MVWKIGVAAALGICALGLAGCGESGTPQAAAAGGSVEVTNARMVLNAVSGNPAAVYFDLVNNSDRAITIRGASIEGAASAELHSYQEWDRQMVMGEMAPLALQPGDTASFAPGGQHVMAMGVSPQLQAGGTTEVTLNLLGGGTQSFPVSILAAGIEDEAPPPLPAPTGAAAEVAD